MVDTDVLIAGADPVGLTAAIELACREVDFRIVDPFTASTFGASVSATTAPDLG